MKTMILSEIIKHAPNEAVIEKGLEKMVTGKQFRLRVQNQKFSLWKQPVKKLVHW